MSEKDTNSSDDQRPQSSLPAPASAAGPPKDSLHPSVYIAIWITMSSSVILFNKWILHTAKFEYPLFLTTWHLVFATAMTQFMARGTKMLDSRHKVPMNSQVYMRAIVPIGLFFSLSLICGNVAYLYLSVSFIQMLKASNAVATLLATWAFGIAPPSLKTFGNVSLIVVGVVIASYGEVKFDLTGFLVQVLGIVFEATRLVMVQRLLSSAEFKMDPLVSLYYFAPACAVMNGICCLIWEGSKLTLSDVESLGYFTLLANGAVAFLLNVSVVFLIGKTSALVLTLSGVLKDILLVVASMVIFQDPVSGLQFFGYSIALSGLVYYKLGAEQLQKHAMTARLNWNEYRAKSPLMSKVVVILALVVIIMLLVGSQTPIKQTTTRSEWYSRLSTSGKTGRH